MGAPTTGTTGLGSPQDNLQNHTRMLRQFKETTEVAQRQRGDPNSSFVKLGELLATGVFRYVNAQLSYISQGGGGSGTVVTTDSVTGNGSSGTPIELVNDNATPGNSYYYGTNSSGVKGWNTLAGAGLGTVTSVGITAGSSGYITSAGGPITSSGNITVDLSTSAQTALATATAINFSTGAGWNSSSGVILLSLISAIDVIIPYACTLQEVDIDTQGTGSCIVDVWKAASRATPTSSNDITGGTPPSISSGTQYTNTTLSGWTTAFATNDKVRFTLASVSGFTSVIITLRLK